MPPARAVCSMLDPPFVKWSMFSKKNLFSFILSLTVLQSISRLPLLALSRTSCNYLHLFLSVSLCTGVCVGIYYEGIYMVKVILAEIRHFECPNEKVEENRLVTKSSILSMESLGWPNTQIQIHKYTNMCI